MRPPTEAGSCVSHLGRCHVDGLFEDFQSIALANQKRRIVAAKLLAITEFGFPFPGVENHAAFQARDGTSHAIIVKAQIDHHSLQIASDGVPATENTGRSYTHTVFAKKRCHCSDVLAVVGLRKL